jgi:hypothetical protein
MTTSQFRQIIDTIYVSVMGPEGGGRNPISNRLLRHFNFISFTTIENNSLERIFSTILGIFVSSNFQGEECVVDPTYIVEATIEVYDTIAIELLSTPVKSHHTFNLRNLAPHTNTRLIHTLLILGYTDTYGDVPEFLWSKVVYYPIGAPLTLQVRHCRMQVRRSQETFTQVHSYFLYHTLYSLHCFRIGYPIYLLSSQV